MPQLRTNAAKHHILFTAYATAVQSNTKLFTPNPANLGKSKAHEFKTMFLNCSGGFCTRSYSSKAGISNHLGKL